MDSKYKDHKPNDIKEHMGLVMHDLQMMGQNPVTKKRSVGLIVLGIIAGTVTSMAFVQQAIQLWFIKHEATSLTWFTLSVCALGQILWVSYGAAIQDYIVMSFAVVSLLVYVALFGTKLRFKD
tara:strand:- start:111 stop:479 length:369 start_codon:yes stop_codon:yes gene_type:complete